MSRSCAVDGVAVIEGKAAFVLAYVLAGSLRNRLTLRELLDDAGLSEAERDAALAAAAALAEAGGQWREAQLPRCGNAATRGSGELAPSGEIDVAMTSTLLRISARRVRQLAAAGDLPAVRTTRGWRFERSEVVAFRDRRDNQEAVA